MKNIHGLKKHGFKLVFFSTCSINPHTGVASTITSAPDAKSKAQSKSMDLDYNQMYLRF